MGSYFCACRASSQVWFPGGRIISSTSQNLPRRSHRDKRGRLLLRRSASKIKRPRTTRTGQRQWKPQKASQTQTKTWESSTSTTEFNRRCERHTPCGSCTYGLRHVSRLHLL